MTGRPTSDRAKGDRAGGDVGARPGPLEVEPADPPVHVQHLADRYSPGHAATPSSPGRSRRARRRRLWPPRSCSRGSRSPASGHSTRAWDQPAAVVAREMRERCRFVQPEVLQDRGGDRAGKNLREGGLQRGPRTIVAASDVHVASTRSKPARRAHVERHSNRRPSSCGAEPVARCVQHHRTADAEMRPQQRAASRVATAPSIQTASSTSCATPWTPRARTGRDVERQGSERRRRRDDGVTEAPRDREPGTVAAGLRQRLTARREHDDVRRDTPVAVREDEIAAASLVMSMIRVAATQRRARRVDFAQQRVEHVARAIGVGKSLPCSSSWSDTPSDSNHATVSAARQRAKHAADDRGLATPEIPLRDGRRW